MPEVEIIVRELRHEIVGRRILGVETDWSKYFRLPKSEAAFRRRVAGKRITAVDRRGKNILIHLTDGYLLLVHQKISGRLLVGNWERKTVFDERGSRWQSAPGAAPKGRFLHLLFELDDGRQIGLSDLRKFAKVLCAKEAEILSLPELHTLGPEPLDPHFTFPCFQQLVARRKGAVKPTLLNPRFIAGIGNIYSDEILYAAGIHPLSRLARLRQPQVEALYRAIKTILGRALRLGGTGIDRMRNSGYDKVRMVYQRENCPRGHAIQRIRIGGRSAHFCVVEQRLY